MTEEEPQPQPPRAERDSAEIELKFDLRPADLRRLQKHPAFVLDTRILKLSSVYYDTPAFDLRRQGLSLRVRGDGSGHVQTVKQVRSTDLFDRDEWETPVPRAALDPQALAGTPVAKTLGKHEGEIRPVFRNRVTREVRLWTSGETVIEIAVDRGEVRAGVRRERIAELELEFKAGDPRAVYALARELFELTPLRLSLTSKGERGYRLASAVTAGRTLNPALTPEMTVAEAFSAIARSCLVQIMDSADAFRRAPEPEGVHQIRIGLRRLRTALRIFKLAVKDERFDWLDAELSWLAAELGDARNLDVFLEETFQPVAAGLSDPRATARYAAQLEKARTGAYDRAKTALDSARFAQLALEVALWTEDGAWKAMADSYRKVLLASPIGPFAVHALDHMRKQVRNRGENLGALDVPSRHKLRIRAKRLRYATDFFALAFGDEAGKKRRNFTGALKALQTSLGQLNDIAQASASAHQVIKGGGSTSLAFVAGEIVGRVGLKEPKILGQAVEAYDGFTAAKRFWPKTPKAADEADGLAGKDLTPP